MFMEPRNRFQGMNSAILSGLAGRYDNPIPTWFLAPIDFLTIPAQSKTRQQPIISKIVSEKTTFEIRTNNF